MKRDHDLLLATAHHELRKRCVKEGRNPTNYEIIMYSVPKKGACEKCRLPVKLCLCEELKQSKSKDVIR